MNNIKQRAAIYCRVSTAEQVDGFSLSEQERICKEYCERMNYKVVGVFVDGGKSGKNLDRYEFKKMFECIENDEIDVIIVYKLDRLSRKLRDVVEFVEDTLDVKKINLISTSEGFDLKTPNGRLMLYMLASFAENERKNIVDRSKVGKLAAAEAGRSNGGSYIATGYKTKNGFYVVDEAEAETVKLIFNMFLDGYNYTQIANYLSNKFGKFWYSTTIQNIITNSFYIGKMKYGGKYYQGNYETFIDKSTFDKAQIKAKKISQGYNSRSRSKFACLCSGLVYCARCGSKYYTSTPAKNKDGSTRTYMYCYRRNKAYKQYQRDGIQCDNIGLRAEYINRIVLDEILKINIDVETIKKENKKVNEKLILEKNIKSNEEKIEKLIDLFANDTIPIDVLNKKIESLQNETEKLKSNLKDLEDDKTLLEKKEVVNFINKDDIQEILKGDDMNKQRPIVEYLIDRIEVDGENVNIYWNF